MVEDGFLYTQTPWTCTLVSGPRGTHAARPAINAKIVLFVPARTADSAPGVCAWPRAPWLHPAPSRTWSCPMAAPESTARGTVWEARPLRTLPRGQATDALSYPHHRGVEQWQLVGLITQRSRVRIPPPLLMNPRRTSVGALLCLGAFVSHVVLIGAEQIELGCLLCAA